MYRSAESVGTKAAGPVQSLVRIVVGFLFACHGAASLFGVLGGAVGTHGGTVPFGAWPGWWAAAIQLVGGTWWRSACSRGRRRWSAPDRWRTLLQRAPADRPAAHGEQR